MTHVEQQKEEISAADLETGETVGEKPAISFVWVFSDDDDRLDATFEEYLAVFRALPSPSEFVIVNDGADTAEADSLLEAVEKARIRTKYLSFHRRAGESAAYSAAFKETSGEIIVILPSYLQTHPGDVPLLIEKIEQEGLDYVASWRSPRVDRQRHRRQSEVFNWLTQRATGLEIHDINSGLRAMRRAIAEEVPVYGDLFRFLPVLAAMQGFKIGEVKTRHLTERVKKGDYRLGIYFRRLLDLLTLFFLFKFTRKPLRFFGLIGGGTFAIGTLLVAYLILERVLGSSLANRPLLIVGVLLVVLGVQLFSIGLLGELIIFTHAGELKEYNVSKVFTSSPTSSEHGES